MEPRLGRGMKFIPEYPSVRPRASATNRCTSSPNEIVTSARKWWTSFTAGRASRIATTVATSPPTIMVRNTGRARFLERIAEVYAPMQ